MCSVPVIGCDFVRYFVVRHAFCQKKKIIMTTVLTPNWYYMESATGWNCWDRNICGLRCHVGVEWRSSVGPCMSLLICPRMVCHSLLPWKHQLQVPTIQRKRQELSHKPPKALHQFSALPPTHPKESHNWIGAQNLTSTWDRYMYNAKTQAQTICMYNMY